MAVEKNKDGHKKLKELEQTLQRYRRESEAVWANLRPEMELDHDMYNGKQWSKEDRAHRGVAKDGLEAPATQVSDRPRPTITMNRIAAMLDAVYGAFLHNQMGVGFVPRVPSYDGAAPRVDEVLTGALTQYREDPAWDAASVDRCTFFDTMVGGLGCQQMSTAIDEDGETIIVGEHLNPFMVGWDPRASAPGFADRRWDFYKTKISATEYEDMFDETPPSKGEGPTEEGGGSGADRTVGDTEAGDGFMIYHFQWYEMEEFRTVRMAVPLPDGRIQVVKSNLSNEQIKELEDKGAVRGTDFVVGDKGAKRRAYWEAFTYEGAIKIVRRVEVNAFTRGFMTGKREVDTGIVYGLVRHARDPQRYANTFFSLFVEILAFSGKGYFFETGAFPPHVEPMDEVNKPDSWTEVAEGALVQQRIQPKKAQEIPPGAYDLLNLALSSVPMNLGINMESLGMNDIQQAGVTEDSRKRASMGVVGWLFAEWRTFLHRQGALALKFMIEYIEPGTLVRTAGGPEAHYAPLNFERGVKYDVVVDEVPDSPGRLAEARRILPMLLQQAAAVSPQAASMLLDAAVSVSGLPSPLLRSMKEEASKPNPAAERQKQIQEAAQLAAIEKDRADGELSKAKAAGVSAEAIRNQSQAMLNQAKAQDLAQGAQQDAVRSAIDIQNNQQMASIRHQSARMMAEIRLREKAFMADMNAIMQRRQLEFQAEQQRIKNDGSRD